jgi:DnaJ-class molecular chaperone
MNGKASHDAAEPSTWRTNGRSRPFGRFDTCIHVVTVRPMETPYSRLGVPEHATDDEIRATYRRLAHEHHPDRHGSSPEKDALFKQINSDYNLLRDPTRRRELDAALAAERAEQAKRAAAISTAPRTSMLRTIANAVPLETWVKLGLGAAMIGAVAASTPRRSSPASPRRATKRESRSDDYVLCKAIKADGDPCPNPALEGNYGRCGVHRRR